MTGTYRSFKEYGFPYVTSKTHVGFLVAQTVKNLPVMPETWVQSSGWEDTMEKGMTTHSSILAWRIHSMDRGAWQATVHGVTRVKHDRVTHTHIDTSVCLWVINTRSSHHALFLSTSCYFHSG